MYSTGGKKYEEMNTKTYSTQLATNGKTKMKSKENKPYR